MKDRERAIPDEHCLGVVARFFCKTSWIEKLFGDLIRAYFFNINKTVLEIDTPIGLADQV